MIARLDKAKLSNMITKFQWQVYQHLMTVPAGKVTTYKQIAKAVKCYSSQPVGQALKKNPFAPEVPCHRVVRTNLTLGGFQGSVEDKTVERKKKILEAEGVEFEVQSVGKLNEYKVMQKCVWDETVKKI